jgi:hypothetical protein
MCKRCETRASFVKDQLVLWQKLIKNAGNSGRIPQRNLLKLNRQRLLRHCEELLRLSNPEPCLAAPGLLR